jgi:hypothetical protein
MELAQKWRVNRAYFTSMTNSAIKLSFLRALLFQVVSVTRFIYIVPSTATKLELRVYSDRTLTVEEQDAYNAVAGEMAGDFVQVEVIPYFLVETRPFQSSHYEGILVYARYEPQSTSLG